MRVGIIGAGIAGLAAAYELSGVGHEVEVFERNPRVGGLLDTCVIEGTHLEKFYHHFFSTDTDLLDYVEKLGISDQLKWHPSSIGIFTGGHLYPFSTPRHVLSFSPIPLLDRIRMGAVLFYLSKTKEWKQLEPWTVERWMRRYAGLKAYDVVWGPLLYGKFDEYASEIGMPWLYARIHTRANSRTEGMKTEKLGYFKGSVKVLVDKVHDAVLNRGGKVHTGVSIDRIAIQDGRATGLFIGGERKQFDSIIVTTASSILLRLAPELSGPYRTMIEASRYHSALVVVLKLSRPLSPYYWLNVNDPAYPFLAVIEHTNLISPSEYGGKRILYLGKYCSPQHRLFRMDDESLLKEYYAALHKMFPHFEPEQVEEAHVFRGPNAQPIVTTDYTKKIPPHRTPIQNLYLANMSQIYPEDRGTNYSIRLGRTVSRILISDFEARKG
jgi:protoporphyrinogen oxidase